MIFQFLSLFSFLLLLLSTSLLLVSSQQHNDDDGNSKNSNNNNKDAAATFTASIPEDRTICNQFGDRLSYNELLTEESRLLPASMRIRKGIVRQSAQSRMTTPMYISFTVANQTVWDAMIDSEAANNGGDYDNISTDVIDARATADSIARTLGFLRSSSLSSSSSSIQEQVKYWERLISTPSPRDPHVVVENKYFAEVEVFPMIPMHRLLRALVETGIGVFSDTSNAGIPTLMSHLSMARIPVIKFAACRSNETFYNYTSNSNNKHQSSTSGNIIPWPLVYGSPYERFGFVVGVDLEFVYVVVPSLAEEAIAISRAEFLTRWHHTEEFEDINEKTQKVEKVKRVIMHRMVASVFRPYNSSLDQSGSGDAKNNKKYYFNRFEGVVRQLNRPPRVVSFDGFC